MARHSPTARQRGAELVPQRGIDWVANSHGVKPQTVRNWCREFGISPVGNGALGSLSSEASPGTIDGLSLGLSADDFGRINGFRFAPNEFTQQLGEIAAFHYGDENPTDATSGLAGVVASVRAVASDYIGTDDSAVIGDHVRRLDQIIEITAARAAHDPVVALRILNDILAKWGRTGTEPERHASAGAGLQWDDRRFKAERAVESLVPQLASHPERCPLATDPPYCGRSQDRIEAVSRFDLRAGPIFADPDPSAYMSGDPHEDWELSEAGRDSLISMAESAATEAGLWIGTDAEIRVGVGAKGSVRVGYRVLDRMPETVWRADAIRSTLTRCERCGELAVKRWETIGRPAPDGTIRTYRCGAHAPFGETPRAIPAHEAI